MSIAILRGDARSLPLPDGSVDLICTSPPYFGLRSYSDDGEHYEGQIGSEATPGEWLAAMLECTAEWARVLKPEGSMFVNLGDKYASGGRATYDRRDKGINGSAGNGERGAAVRPQDGAPEKCLLGLPWRYALACMDDLGLILRRDIIWSKPNPLPESAADRCATRHEYIFHLVRQPRYYSAVDEIREPTAPVARQPKTVRAGPLAGSHGAAGHDGNGMRMAETYNNALGKLPGSVWEIPSQPLIVPAHLALDHGSGQWDMLTRQHGRATRQTAIASYACACPTPDAPTRPALVVDPFGGTGTTALVAHVNGRDAFTVDRSAGYCRLARWRTTDPGERARAMRVPRPPHVPDGQDALFDMEAS